MSITASVIIAMEGMPKTAFLMARALATQPKGGVTPSALFRMVPMDMEDLDHFLETYPRFFFMDINRVKITAEAIRALERVLRGMNESRASLEQVARTLERLDHHEADRLAHLLGLEETRKKRSVLVDRFIQQVYQYPDTVREWVETAAFSEAARRMFHALWEKPEGEVEASRLRKASGLDEYRAEQALWELLRNLVCFERFDFDDNDLLRRNIVLLEQVRCFRRSGPAAGEHSLVLIRNPDQISCCGDASARLLARVTCAAGQRPLTRNRNGKLSAASLRGIERFTGPGLEHDYLLELIDGGITLGYLREEEDVSILPGTRLSLWTGHAIETIHAQLARHALYEKYPEAGRLLRAFAQLARPGQWYSLRNAVQAAISHPRQNNPAIRYHEGQFRYGEEEDAVLTRKLLTLLQETFHRFGIVDLGKVSGGDVLVSLTSLGHALLLGQEEASMPAPMPSGSLIVKPDLEIFVPMEETPLQLLPVLSIFSEVSGVSDHTILFRLTREKYLSALQRGYPGDILPGLLEQHAREQRIPENVRRTLEDWNRTPRRVRIRKVLLIECEDPVMLAELSSYPELASHLRALDPEHALALQGLLTAEVRELLWRKGFIVE